MYILSLLVTSPHRNPYLDLMFQPPRCGTNILGPEIKDLILKLFTSRLALDATILAAPSYFEFVVYGAQWLPFPMTHADLVIHARWSDLSEVHDPTRDLCD